MWDVSRKAKMELTVPIFPVYMPKPSVFLNSKIVAFKCIWNGLEGQKLQLLKIPWFSPVKSLLIMIS